QLVQIKAMLAVPARRSKPGGQPVLRDDVRDRWPRADDGELIALHEHLRDEGPRVVARGLHRAIAAGRQKGYQIAAPQSRVLAGLAGESGALAGRVRHVDRALRGGRRWVYGRGDIVMRVVKRGPDEIVHARIDDEERPAFARLPVDDAAHQDARIADDEAPG